MDLVLTHTLEDPELGFDISYKEGSRAIYIGYRDRGVWLEFKDFNKMRNALKHMEIIRKKVERKM